MKTIKVGDVVAWAGVPVRALVREAGGRFAVRHDLRHGSYPFDTVVRWLWGHGFECHSAVTVVALDLTGDESVDDLRRLAEVFEVREHLMSTGDDSIWFGEHIDDLAPQLQAAGWRPGMTAEDAARLLAEVKP